MTDPKGSLNEAAAFSPRLASEAKSTLGNGFKILQPQRGCGHNPVMPQALSAVYIHLVFSTKERRPFLRDRETHIALHSYIGGISKRLQCPTIIVGGVEDHVHLLARFGRTCSQAEWVKELKRVSNIWLKERDPDYRDFEWQGGYSSFSIGASDLERVEKYIANQEDHHQTEKFQDELRSMLREHRIEWDERYLWD